MTLPLVCSFYYEIPVYAVWINLILLPFMGVVLGCGLIGGILGTAVPRLAHLILGLPDLLLLFYEKVCGAFLALPCAQWITGSPGRARLIVYYGLLAVLLFSAGKRTEGQKSTGMRKRLCLGGGMVLLVGILLFPHKKQMEIDVLDVGQGDGIYLCTSDGISMFFDGGSSSVSGVGTYRILPFLKAKGVRRIDYWFVSHTDADHINGLEEILQLDYPIGTVVFPEYGYRDASLEKLEEEIIRWRMPMPVRWCYCMRQKGSVVFLPVIFQRQKKNGLQRKQSCRSCLFIRRHIMAQIIPIQKTF